MGGVCLVSVLSSGQRRWGFDIFQVDAVFLKSPQDVIQQQREGVDVFFSIQSLDIHNLFADFEGEKRFVLIDRISHRRAGIGFSTDCLIKILAG